MNKIKHKVIGISGPAHSGKDTSADYILKHLPLGYIKSSFADPMKQMCSILGLTKEQLYGDLKETIDETFNCTPRRILQTLGTEWGRELIHNDIWIHAMQARLENLPFGGFVIPDVRFENEADFVRKNGVLIHIVGRFDDNNSQVEEHTSESGIVIKEQDIKIYNDDLIDTFYDNLAYLLKLLETRK